MSTVGWESWMAWEVSINTTSTRVEWGLLAPQAMLHFPWRLSSLTRVWGLFFCTGCPWGPCPKYCLLFLFRGWCQIFSMDWLLVISRCFIVCGLTPPYSFFRLVSCKVCGGPRWTEQRGKFSSWLLKIPSLCSHILCQSLIIPSPLTAFRWFCWWGWLPCNRNYINV